MSSPVVVITGKKGSGKDTFGAFVMTELARKFPGLPVSHAVFAKPLKDMVADLLGIPKEVCYGDIDAKESYEVYGKTARYWLQIFGTEVFRAMVHPDFWVHRMLRTIINGEARGWVLTDCRFPNEWEILSAVLEGRPLLLEQQPPSDCRLRVDQHFKCALVRVLRPGFEDSGDTHVSETSIDLLDRFNPHIVVNDGTIPALREKARLLVASLLP